MSVSTQRVCAFYSKGPHFLRLLQFLRTEYPQATITAMVPPSYPVAFLEGRCDRIVPTAVERPSSPGGLLSLLQQIRSEHFDVLVVMFHSTRLRLVAGASGAGEARYFTADGRYLPVSRNLLAGIGGLAVRNIRGRLTYAKIWWNVHRLPVKK